MAKTILDSLKGFGKYLEDNFAQFPEKRAPLNPNYGVIANTTADTVIKLMEAYFLADPATQPLKSSPYRLIFTHDAGSKAGSVSLGAYITEDHPLWSYTPKKSVPSFVNIDLGILKRKRCKLGNDTQDPLMYQSLSISPDVNANVNLDLPAEEFAIELGRAYVAKYQEFFDSLELLDELQADFQPEENQAFAENLTAVCVGLTDPLMGTVNDIFDANDRYKFLMTWKRYKESLDAGESPDEAKE